MSWLPDVKDPSSTACSTSTTVEDSKNSTNLLPCFLLLISTPHSTTSNCSTAPGSIRVWASYLIAMRTNFSFEEQYGTVFCASFPAAWSTSPTSVGANAGFRCGNKRKEIGRAHV